MKYTLRKPDGSETILTRDELVIGYNNREIDSGWQAKAAGTPEWSQVGALIGVSRQPASHTKQPQAMSHVQTYMLLLLGAALGYIGSYFAQPVKLQRAVSAGDYIKDAWNVLLPSRPSTSMLLLPPDRLREAEDFLRSVCITAWICLILGVAVMGGIIFAIESRKRQPATSEADV